MRDVLFVSLLACVACAERNDGRCDGDSDCGDNQVCDEGLCQDLPSQAQPCNVDDDCARRERCISGECELAGAEGEGEGGCDGGEAALPPAGPALRVVVVDNRTQFHVCDALVVAEHDELGPFLLEVVGTEPLCNYEGAFSTAGIFALQVTHPAYAEFFATGIDVEEDACGVLQTRDVNVPLEPLN